MTGYPDAYGHREHRAAIDKLGRDLQLPLFAAAARRTHGNSRAAWRQHDAAGREAEVLAALRAIGRPATDREVLRAMGRADMNECRPAVTHLVQGGVLAETERVTCPATGRLVRRTWFAPRGAPSAPAKETAP